MLVEDSQTSRAMMTKKYAHCPLKKRPVLVREERPATPPTSPPHPAHLATRLYYDYHCKYYFLISPKILNYIVIIFFLNSKHLTMYQGCKYTVYFGLLNRDIYRKTNKCYIFEMNSYFNIFSFTYNNK